jgi:predicted dehydrogenase
MSRRTSRRQFIQESALAGIGFWAAGGLTAQESKSANDKIRFACIGVGGKGSSDTDHVGQLGEIVALCDVDETFLENKAKKFPQAKKFADFREMLEKMGKDIDAVTVSTPDHMHAPASVMAMKMGKHVYCQKPLCHDVYEARVMRETAAKMKLATSMGNQGTANSTLRTGVEVIQSGALGAVKEVHAWTNRPIWPQAPKVMTRPKEDPVPKYLSWDLWLGTAPVRPYSHGGAKPESHRGAYHDFNWRGWWDFGTGALGDMACHTMNMPYMALKLGHPDSIVAECGDLNPETYPSWATVTYQYPARGSLPPVKFVWYEGQKDGKKNLPPLDLLQGEPANQSASLIIGEKGTMYSPADYGERWVLLPKKQFEGFKNPTPTLARHTTRNDDLNQKADWVAAIKGGPKALANFDYAGLLAEAILLGNVAIRMQGKKLEWDGPGFVVKNDSQANQYLKREYRKGWSL